MTTLSPYGKFSYLIKAGMWWWRPWGVDARLPNDIIGRGKAIQRMNDQEVLNVFSPSSTNIFFPLPTTYNQEFKHTNTNQTSRNKQPQSCLTRTLQLSSHTSTVQLELFSLPSVAWPTTPLKRALVRPRRTRLNSRTMPPTLPLRLATSLLPHQVSPIFPLFWKSPMLTLHPGAITKDDPNRTEGSWNQTVGSAKEAVGGLIGSQVCSLPPPSPDFLNIANIYTHRTWRTQVPAKMPKVKAKKPKANWTTSVPASPTASLVPFKEE